MALFPGGTRDNYFFRQARPDALGHEDNLSELTEPGSEVVSLTEALDATTPIGRETAAMLALVAQFEREILRERVRARIAPARKERRTTAARGRLH